MGRLIAGILGNVYGKVGNVVGSNWKGINTVRQYAIPSNPQSTLQTAQRAKFKTVSLLGSSLLATLIDTFWNPFAIKMSGFNHFVQQFIINATASGLATADCLVAKGSLESSTITSATYDATFGTCAIHFDLNTSGNGLSTDDCNVLVLDKSNNKVVGYSKANCSRDDDTASLNIGTGLTATDLVGYIWFSRGSSSDFIVSNSVGADLTAA